MLLFFAPSFISTASVSGNGCTRCTGAWSALGLVALRLHSPAAGRTVATVLAASAGNDLMQAGFQWLCAHATTEQKVAADPAILRGVRDAA